MIRARSVYLLANSHGLLVPDKQCHAIMTVIGTLQMTLALPMLTMESRSTGSCHRDRHALQSGRISDAPSLAPIVSDGAILVAALQVDRADLESAICLSCHDSPEFV